jgi:hypothetical protein
MSLKRGWRQERGRQRYAEIIEIEKPPEVSGKIVKKVRKIAVRSDRL